MKPQTAYAVAAAAVDWADKRAARNAAKAERSAANRLFDGDIDEFDVATVEAHRAYRAAAIADNAARARLRAVTARAKKEMSE